MRAFDTIPRKTAITIMALAAMECAASLYPKSSPPAVAVPSPPPAQTASSAPVTKETSMAHRSAWQSR